MNNSDSLQNSILKTLDTSGGKWGIYAKDLSKKRIYAYNEHEVFETMSVIKLPILAYLLKEVDKGKLDLHQEIRIKAKQLSKGSGILQYFSKRPLIKLYDIALLMIIVSDNSATNILIDLLGKDNINSVITSLGFQKTKLTTDKIHFPLNDRKLGLGKTTPYEMATLLEGIIKGKYLSQKSSRVAFNMLWAQNYLTIPRYLPYWTTLGTTKSKIQVVASKSGSCYYEKDNQWYIANDVGYIRTKRTHREYIFSIFSEGKADINHLWTSDNKQMKTLARISKVLYQYFEEGYK